MGESLARTSYRHYWEEMPCFLSVHDRDFRIVDGNRRFREAFGERIGDYCYSVYKGRDEVCPDCPVEATFKDGKSHVSEQSLVTKSGEEMPVVVHTTPIADKEGKIAYVMEMHTDIREVKHLQRRLHSSQKQLATMFEQTPCYIAILDRDFTIRHANRLFRETFGDTEGTPCYEVYKHRNEPCLVCQAQQTFADGESRHHEEVVVSASGKKINVWCSTTPVFDEAGNVESVMELATDITQIRELQSQLTSIGLLVGSISHGIKGLLTGLDGGIYLVNSGFQKDNPKRVKRGWEMVERNVGRIRSMVLDILYYAKDRDLTVTDIKVASLVDEVREVVGRRAEDLDIEFRSEIDAAAESFQGDAAAIRAMLVNVLENSIDACRGTGKERESRVDFNVRREEPWIVFDIADNGIGMDQETREKIFSLFFSSKGIKGTGLGLFISNKIVDKHGGKIEVESEQGEGSRFLIRLPLVARPSTRPEGE